MKRVTRILVFSLVVNAVLLAAGGYFVYKKGGLSYLVYKAAPTAVESTYFRGRRSIFKAMPQREGAIVFLGDSLTERCPWQELLQRPDVLNRGIGQDTLVDVQQHLDEVLHHPRKLFLMIGINDLMADENASEHVASRYRSMVAAIKRSSPRTQIIIQSILPVSKKNYASRPPDLADTLQRTLNASIRKVNEKIKTLADGHRVIYVDIHSRLLDRQNQLNDKYSFDGLHLNGDGYKVWKQAILPLVK